MNIWSFQAAPQDLKGEKEHVPRCYNPSIRSLCQLYHLGVNKLWIWRAVKKKASKDLKGTKKKTQNLWSAEALALSSAINHRRHDGQTNIWHRERGSPRLIGSPALSTASALGWIVRRSHGVCNGSGDPELTPAPSITRTSGSKHKVLLLYPQNQTWLLLSSYLAIRLRQRAASRIMRLRQNRQNSRKHQISFG